MRGCKLGSFNLPSNQQLSSLTHLDLSANGIKYIDCQKFPAQFFDKKVVKNILGQSFDIKMTLDISGNTGFRFINTNDYYTKSIRVINFEDSLPLHQVNQHLHIANTNTTKVLNQLQFKVLKNAKPLILSMSKGDQDFVEKLHRFYKELDTQLSKLPGQLNKNPHQMLPSSGGIATNGNELVNLPDGTGRQPIDLGNDGLSSDHAGSNGPDQAQPGLHDTYRSCRYPAPRYTSQW